MKIIEVSAAKNIWCLLILLTAILSTTLVNAQFPRYKSTTEIYDTAYLNRSPSKWSIRLYSASKYQQLIIASHSTDAKLRYSPTKYYAIGLGFSYNRLNLDLGVNVFRSKPGTVTADKSASFNFISSLYAGQHLLEIYLQDCNGMFGSADGKEISSLPGNSAATFRPDISALNFGIDYNYLLNSAKVTFGTLVGTEIQKRSAGGAMIGVFFSSYDLHADSSIIPSQYSSYFEEHTKLTDAYIFNIGITGGYAYTLVLPLHLYLSLSLAPGFSFSRSELKANEEWYVGGKPVNFSLKLISRGAFGYGGKKIYGVFTVVNDRSIINISNKNSFNQEVGKIKLVFGYRFN